MFANCQARCAYPASHKRYVAKKSLKRYVLDMTVDAIKDAIGQLSDVEKTILTAWLARQDTESWDKQIEEDFSEGGSGMALVEQWDAEIRAGQTISLEEFLEERNSEQNH